jgi:hypothetical protein
MRMPPISPVAIIGLPLAAMLLCTGGAHARQGAARLAQGAPDAVMAPVLVDIVPASAPAGEAYPLTVTIRGSGFLPTGNLVEFGPLKIPDVPAAESGRISCAIPKAMPSRGEVPPLVLLPGEYRVTVTTGAGTSNALIFTLTRGP